jgi:hypothetical protein
MKKRNPFADDEEEKDKEDDTVRNVDLLNMGGSSKRMIPEKSSLVPDKDEAGDEDEFPDDMFSDKAGGIQPPKKIDAQANQTELKSHRSLQ